jgi:hypothetical protein
MLIQVEQIWLFECSITDPFIFEKTDGVNITMSADDDKTIENLSIDKAEFYIRDILKGGLQSSNSYGGKDIYPLSQLGKASTLQRFEFNFPADDEMRVRNMIGKEYCVLGMKRDRTYFVSFARYTVPELMIDNDVIQRVSLQGSKGSQQLYTVNNINVTEVVNTIECESVVVESTGFDYELDAAMN